LDKIKVIIVKPNEEPRVEEIGHELEDLQNFVGGLIQYVELEDNVVLICNEEGKLRGLTPNRKVGNDVIVGDFIIVGIEDEDETSLTDDQIEKYTKEFTLQNEPICKELSIKEVQELKGDYLILQGCGGDLQEWIDGIKEMFIEQKVIEKQDFQFKEVYSFKNKDATNMLFGLDGLNVGRLAIVRLGMTEQFGAMWLSDYKDNGYIKVEEKVKPRCELIGQDGNIFNLMGIASRTLKRNKMSEQATEMCNRITSSGSYEEALGIISEYVEITGKEDEEDFEYEDDD